MAALEMAELGVALKMAEVGVALFVYLPSFPLAKLLSSQSCTLRVTPLASRRESHTTDVALLARRILSRLWAIVIGPRRFLCHSHHAHWCNKFFLDFRFFGSVPGNEIGFGFSDFFRLFSCADCGPGFSAT